MATEATVLVASVEKNDKGWYELVDGNGTKYSTKKQSIAEPAYGLVDKQAKLTFTVSQNGDFTNRYLDKVEAVAAVAEQNGNPNPGDGTYVKGKTNPEDQLWITARHAVTEAREALLPWKPEQTTKQFATEVGILAHAFFNSVISLRHLEHAQTEPDRNKSDDSIPF